MRIVEDLSFKISSEIFSHNFFDFDWDNLKSKVFITSSHKPSKNTHIFAENLVSLIPNSIYSHWEKRKSFDSLVPHLKAENYSHLFFIFENQKSVKYLSIGFLFTSKPIFLTFKISNIVLSHKISNHGNPTESFPELILNNFNSEAGKKIGKLLSSIFPINPDFLGRQAVTFHNQRDYIFIRRHRYIFDGVCNKASTQELGPSFTMKLYFVSHTFNFLESIWSYKECKKIKRQINANSQHSMDNKVYLL